MENIENVENVETFNKDEELCELINVDGKYFLVDLATGEEKEFGTKVTTDGYYILPQNRANRKCYNKKNLDAIFEKGETVKLTYKASKHFGPTGNKIPNEKLIAYLPEDLQNEYKEIVMRAIEARNAAKTKPMTQEDKIKAQIAKYEAKLAELEAQKSKLVEDLNNSDDE